MKLSNKKLILLLVVVAALFLMSGCTVPTDEAGKVIPITLSTTFKEIFDSESWFSAIFVFPLSQCINWLAPKIGVVGAIAIVTATINLIIFAFTLKPTIQQQQMQLIQPEMNKITKKYEGKTDDASKMRQAQEMQDLYKKHNINPLGSLLTTFIQFPVIIAMYQSVQRSYAVMTGTFLGINLDVTPIDGLKSGQWLYLVIFLVMAVFQFCSMQTPQWISKAKAKKEAEIHHRKPEEIKNPAGNMMYYMMIPILVISVMWPTAMTIYWIITSIIMIGKTLLIQFVFIDKAKGGLK